MKNRTMQALLGSSLLALGWAANAQSQTSDHGTSNGGRLRKAPSAAVSPDGSSSQGESVASFDAERWRKELVAGDLDQRQASYEELVQLARRDPAARAALEEWSQGNDELAWTSRLALRELGRGPRGGRSFRQLDPLAGGGFDNWLDAPLGGQGMDHRQLFEDLERRLDELFGSQGGTNVLPAPPAAPAPGSPGQGMRSQSETFQLESTPGGVKVHVEEKDQDGNTQSRDYEAKDMQELLQRYPELRGHIGTQGTPPMELGDLRKELGTLRDRLHSMRQLGAPDAEANRGDTSAQEMPTDVLGIYPGAAAEAGEGLLVERIEPGTIAKAIGIQRGDKILEINGTQISDASDVTRVLRERQPDRS
jgi:hypothetical protein